MEGSSYPNYNEIVGSQNEDFFETQREVNTQDVERMAKERDRNTELNTFYSNSVLNSENEGTVLIVKPEEAQAREVINNPLKLNALIVNSEFNKHKMKDIRVNKRRKIIVMQLENNSAEVIQKLLKVKKLGEIAITSYIPDKDKYKYGVIYPVSTQVNTEQLLESIVHKENSSQVVRLERMKKRNGSEFIESESIKVVFEGDKLPDGLRIGHCYYKVRPFVFSPVQCYHCQRLGHVAESCRSRVRCLICGEGHDKSECNSNSVKCALCSGPHKANDKECVYVSKAREVEKRKANGERHSEAIKNVTLMQSINQIQSSQAQTGLSQPSIKKNARVTVAEVHHTMNSQVDNSRNYSSALIRNKTDTIETELKMLEKKQKQLENNLVGMIGKVLEQHLTKLVIKITECIGELICSSIVRESESNKKLIIQNIIKHHLPVETVERKRLTDEQNEIIEVPELEGNVSEVDMEVISDGELSSDSMEDNGRRKTRQNERNVRGSQAKRKISEQTEESIKGKKKKGKK